MNIMQKNKRSLFLLNVMLLSYATNNYANDDQNWQEWATEKAWVAAKSVAVPLTMWVAKKILKEYFLIDPAKLNEKAIKSSDEWFKYKMKKQVAQIALMEHPDWISQEIRRRELDIKRQELIIQNEQSAVITNKNVARDGLLVHLKDVKELRDEIRREMMSSEDEEYKNDLKKEDESLRTTKNGILRDLKELNK